jgi:predicted ATPase/DNA-binding SARP family transcriptional activator
MMERLSLRFLGPPEVRYQGQTLKFRSRKELALLIYLVVEGGQHSREKLIAFLWPDSDRQRGQASLRNTLVRLRQALAGAGPYLIIEPSVVSFDFSRPFELDLDTVQTASQTSQETTKSADLTHRSPLQAATAVYRGDFLEGFSLADAPEFDDWASLQQEAWHHRLERIFNRLSRLEFEMGQVDQAIDTTTQWLARDSLNEAAYRRLMQLYFLAGNRTAALQAYEQCSRILAEELRVEPDPETIALAERIRRMKESLPSSSSLIPHSSSFGDLPFVGRAGEHSQLVATYQAVGQGRPQVVCVLGEAGIGKTRLTQIFLAWAAIQEADILRGRTFEAGGQLPYQPLVAALRERLERENAPDDLLADVWLAELSQLLPELRDRYPDLPPSTTGDPNFARSRLFEAVAQLGQALAGRKPVVIFIDDLQWADAATLAILPYLCRRWEEGRTRILLLLTLRREALATTPNLREWLAQLEREVSLTRLHLRPLTAEATRQLMEILQGMRSGGVEEQGSKGEQIPPAPLPPSSPAQFAQWLFAETAGQPFFMAETIKMLVEQNILHSTYQPDGQWAVDFGSAIQQIHSQQQLPMPPNVREVILTRLGRLSETAGALLVAGAVLGRACSFERLCQVSGVEELEGLLALDELVKSQLLLESAEVPRPYTFAHDKIRDVVYTEAGDARRRIYHRRAFTGLQTAAAQHPERSRRAAAELAHHALAARLLEPAFRYSVTAGDEAASVYAHAEAISYYHRALDLAPKQDQADNRTHDGETHEELTRLYLGLGRTLELTSQYEQALATYQEMERLAQERSDRSMRLAALMAQITPLATVTAVFDTAQAETLSERALQLAQALGDQTAEAKILWNQLIIYRNSNKAPQAVACGERALALARQLNLRQLMAFVLHDLGYAFSFMADFRQAKPLFDEASDLWREFGNLPMLGDSLVGVCLVCIFTGEYDAAIALFEETLQICQAIDSLWCQAGCRHNIGYVYGDRGQINEAIGVMEESIRLSEIVGFISPLIIVRADLATIYGALGAFERGLEIAQLGLNVAETKMPIFRVYALAALTHLHLWQGYLTEAETLVEQMKKDPHQDGYVFPAMILQAEAELALAQGNYERARAIAEEAIILLRQLGVRIFLPATLYLQGQAWLGLGQPNTARDCWLEARVEAEAIGSRRMLWQILDALSRLETDPTEAERLRQQAREIAKYIADHSPPDLRASFLALPAVRVVLSQ